VSDWNGWRGFPRPPRKRPPPAHGVQVAKIGATWWGVRWIEALERLSQEYSRRLARGRTYARAGRVHDLEVEPGLVSARVTGSRRTPYRVSLRIASIASADWDRAVAAMAEQAVFAAELLAGRMPAAIDDCFRAASASLFPVAGRDLTTECTCPDWANPCKHVAAMHYVLGEAFDKDPFLLFALRGRDRQDVLAGLRRLRAGTDEKAAPADSIATVSVTGRDPADFERAAAPIAVRFAFDAPAQSGGLLRQLGRPSSWSDDSSPADLLGTAYRAAADRARALALDDDGDE
jgi:uncharacterized Zn finger protein